MKLEYSLTNDDFLEYQLYTASKSKRIMAKRKRYKLIIPIIYLGIGVFSIFKKDNLIIASIFIGIAILWFIFYPIRSKKLHIKHYKNHIEDNYKNRINKLTEIEFKDEYIFGKDYTTESKINIKEVNSLIELKNHFFLKLKTDVSLIIPKRAIEDLKDFKKKIIELNIQIIDELNWKFK